MLPLRAAKKSVVGGELTSKGEFAACGPPLGPGHGHCHSKVEEAVGGGVFMFMESSCSGQA